MVSPRPPKLLEKRENYPHDLTSPAEIWTEPHPEITQPALGLTSPLIFEPKSISKLVAFFLLFLLIFLTSSFFFPSSSVSPPCSFWPLLSSGGQWKLLRRDRVSMGYTKLDPGTYRGPEGKPANYSSSHGGSCCLSPSICGHRESADRPACFYLPSISIQGDEACQGFTGTGNVSLAPGVSVV